MYRVQQRLKYLGFRGFDGQVITVNGDPTIQISTFEREKGVSTNIQTTESAIRVFQGSVRPEGEVQIVDWTRTIKPGQEKPFKAREGINGIVSANGSTINWLNAQNAPRWIKATPAGGDFNATSAEKYGTTWVVELVRSATKDTATRFPALLTSASDPTPAISVLSAVEGLQLGASGEEMQVVPIAAGVLVALFLIQRHGTGAVGKLFGPVCAAWFLALGASGLWNIGLNPAVLAALDPRHALHFVTGYCVASYVVLGSVLLAITGAEALYADMGHFGKRAVRIAWFGLVAPALVLNYFGQGALLLREPAAIVNPFDLAFPGWALYPMV